MKQQSSLYGNFASKQATGQSEEPRSGREHQSWFH